MTLFPNLNFKSFLFTRHPLLAPCIISMNALWFQSIIPLNSFSILKTSNISYLNLNIANPNNTDLSSYVLSLRIIAMNLKMEDIMR
jgi:hypothetical protein